MFPPPVSLFTREWIEILIAFSPAIWKSSRLPLYEGVDWNPVQLIVNHTVQCVSLFTREWIEINRWHSSSMQRSVSLFTREWIEMQTTVIIPCLTFRLPLYEGVDWNRRNIKSGVFFSGLPLYEGVDWNACSADNFRNAYVSLFTREWIEIKTTLSLGLRSRSPSLRGSGLKSLVALCKSARLVCLPLYEGVDWNSLPTQQSSDKTQSPSLRGSGLKFLKWQDSHIFQCLPLYEGVDWNTYPRLKWL